MPREKGRYRMWGGRFRRSGVNVWHACNIRYASLYCSTNFHYSVIGHPDLTESLCLAKVFVSSVHHLWWFSRSQTCFRRRPNSRVR
jgi:hypothetical protein